MLSITKKRTMALLAIFVCSGAVVAGGSAQPVDHKVSLKEWLFTPAELTVQAGDSVTWLNDDSTNHDVAFVEAQPANAPTHDKPHKIRKRKAYSLTFDKPGVYKYVCTIHEDYDMKGVVIVK